MNFRIFYFYFEFYIYRAVGQLGRVFANGQVDRGSIPSRIIPKTQNGTCCRIA